jgi:hypothetical protein
VIAVPSADPSSPPQIVSLGPIGAVLEQAARQKSVLSSPADEEGNLKGSGSPPSARGSPSERRASPIRASLEALSARLSATAATASPPRSARGSPELQRQPSNFGQASTSMSPSAHAPDGSGAGLQANASSRSISGAAAASVSAQEERTTGAGSSLSARGIHVQPSGSYSEASSAAPFNVPTSTRSIER